MSKRLHLGAEQLARRIFAERAACALKRGFHSVGCFTHRCALSSLLNCSRKRLKPAPSSEGAGFVNFCDALAASSHRASRSLCGAKVKAKAKSEAGGCRRTAAPVDCRWGVALNHCVIKLRGQLGGHYAQPRGGCQGAVCNGCWQAQ